MYYSLKYDLVVDEDEIKKEAKTIMERAKVYELELGNLASHIESIVDKAIIEGSASDNIAAFLEEVKGLKKNAKKIASDVTAVVSNYVDAIDKADGCVY